MATDAEQKWREHVAGWRASGLSVAAYARRAGLSAVTLGSWKRRLGGGEALSFMEIPFQGAAAGIRLEVNNVRVELPHGFEEGDLRRLLGVLRGLP